MRYDSDPQIVRKILTETKTFRDALNHFNSSESDSPQLFDELATLINPLLTTLDHFSKLHLLNPQLSLSRFSAYHIEQQLLSLNTSIADLFARKQFANLSEQTEWSRNHFLEPQNLNSSEHLLVTLSMKVVQFLETYYADRIHNTRFAAILSEFIGWSEHVEMHGHHDLHSIILFAEKIARDRLVLEHRMEVVREICLLLQEEVFFHQPDISAADQTIEHIALQLSQVYSPYLLALYEALLEDVEIIVVSNHNYQVFETYCHEHHIDVYEEYRDKLRHYFKKSVNMLAADLLKTLRLVRIARILINAEMTYKRYLDLEISAEVVGENLSQDIRLLENAVQQLKDSYPDLVQRYAATLQKVKKFKSELIRPAIQVYGKYLKDPEEFFHHLPQNQIRWIPILDSALACLEQDDDFYQKCLRLKSHIDMFTLK